MPGSRGRMKGRLLQRREGSRRVSSSCGLVASEAGWHWRWRQGESRRPRWQCLCGGSRCSWGRKGGLWSDHGGRGHGDVDEGEAQDAVAGSWQAALGSSVIDVEGGRWGAWSTGR
jgi:hypothetical protein